MTLRVVAALPGADVAAGADAILAAEAARPGDAGSEPLVSIAILTLNAGEHTRACLASIERTTEDYELLLVDNGSTDGTVELLRAYAAERPHVRLVLNGENRGFAGGNNQALALARGRYVVLLNNDTIVTEGWLGRMIAALEATPGAGLAGPVSNYVAGPQLVEAGYATSDGIEPFARDWALAHAGESAVVPRLIGFCLLLRREVVDAVGALDESFGAGNFEDDDYCLRARAAGFGCVIARAAFVHHTGSRTFAGERIDYAASLLRNRGVFEQKWGCSPDELWQRGPAAIDPERRERLRHLPLPEPPVLAAGPAAPTSGELRVEGLLLRARQAVLRHDLAGMRDAFAEPAGWDEPQRGYQAVRHLTELVLATGAALAGDDWIELYGAAADGLLGVLEREPSEPVLLNFAGILLYELTELESACALFDAALRLDPTLDETAANLAAARDHLGLDDRPRLARAGHEALSARAFRIAGAARPVEGLRLSLCMIVKDEEELLPACLEAVRDAVDEIVVVDTGSSDRTVEIAESFGAKVVSFPWNGSFADARNVSIGHASGDWILYLDADEQLAPGSAAQLRDLLGRTWREAFYLIETNHTGGDEAGTAVSHPAMRVFRNRPDYRFEGRIHEQKTRLMPTFLPERFETTTVRVEHYGYLKSRVVGRDKSRRNLELLLREAEESPSPFASFNLGSEYQMLSDWERAARYFDDAWGELHREHEWQTAGFAPMLAARASRAHRECGRIERARDILGEAAALMPDYTDLHFELALCAQALGELPEAERLLRHCLELGDAPPRYAATVGTGSHLAYGILAELAEARGDDAAAIALYRRGLELQPAFTATVLPLVKLLLRSGAAPAELARELPLERPSAALLAASAYLEAGHAQAAEELFRQVLARRPGTAAARMGVLQALLGQRRYAEAVAEAASEPDDAETAPLAASAGLFACAVLGEAAALAAALERGQRVGVADDELELYRAWAARLAGALLEPLPATALEPALAALEALLRVREFGVFGQLVAVYECIDAALEERRARLAELYLRCGYVDSAEDEWHRGPRDAASLVGLAQVALVREQPAEAAVLAKTALGLDPASQSARRLVSALTRSSDPSSIPRAAGR
ncbi:MAG TPA: glycosyltransferase [Gaiellales bacterium]|jgi:GT2 family glycosyltransferase/predicted Zn-dependent protease